MIKYPLLITVIIESPGLILDEERSSEAVMGGGAQYNSLFCMLISPKRRVLVQRTGAKHGQNPLVNYIWLVK